MPIQKFGPYIVQSTLGRGGMGIVYRAKHEESGDVVAVKVLTGDKSEEPYFRRRFEAEIESLLMLEHPRIVRLISHGEQEGQLFYAMECVEGKSLHAQQKLGNQFFWQDVIKITKQICEGLRHAHDRGIFHRDLKPGNLLLCPDGSVKIADFGITKFWDRCDQAVVGTSDFMSPEQANGETITARSDLYSLGCVMYTLLARCPPIQTKNSEEGLKAISTEIPKPISYHCPDVPVQLDAIITRLLEKDPNERVGTSLALIKRLTEVEEAVAEFAGANTEPGKPEEDFDLQTGETTDSHVNRQGTISSEPDSELTLAAVDLNDDATRESAMRGTYFTDVKPNRTRPAVRDPEVVIKEGPVWPYALALIAAISLFGYGIYYIATNESSREQLLATIDGAESPRSATSEMKEFLKRFPDDERAADIKAMVARLNPTKYLESLRRRQRNRGFQALYPIEANLISILESRGSDPTQTQQKLVALESIYNDSDEHPEAVNDCIRNLPGLIESLTQEVEAYQSNHQQEISKALSRARERINGPDAEAAEAGFRACEGIIVIYQDVPWMSDIVLKAKTLLKQRPEKKTEETKE